MKRKLGKVERSRRKVIEDSVSMIKLLLADHNIRWYRLEFSDNTVMVYVPKWRYFWASWWFERDFYRAIPLKVWLKIIREG